MNMIYEQIARQRWAEDIAAASRYRMAAEARRQRAAERWERRARRFQAMARWAMHRSEAMGRPARPHLAR